MSISVAKTSKDRAMKFLGFLYQREEAGFFEHENFEGGSYQWVFKNPRTVFRVAECYDGRWEISIECSSVFKTEEANALLNFFVDIISIT